MTLEAWKAGVEVIALRVARELAEEPQLSADVGLAFALLASLNTSPIAVEPPEVAELRNALIVFVGHALATVDLVLRNSAPAGLDR